MHKAGHVRSSLPTLMHVGSIAVPFSMGVSIDPTAPF